MVFAVGRLEQEPVLENDIGRPLPILVPSEFHNYRLRAGGGELLGPDSSVVEVGSPTPWRRNPQEGGHGGHSAAGDTDPGVAFATIVQQRGASEVSTTGSRGQCVAGSFECVTLIHDRLGPEQLRQFVVEQAGHLRFLSRPEGPGPARIPCPAGQVKEVAGTPGLPSHGTMISRIHLVISVKKLSEPGKIKSSPINKMKPYCCDCQ